MSEKDELRNLSIDLAIKISDKCDSFKGCRSYADQITRCSASVGANIFEAKYAQSRADFIHKLEIALKECNETEFWLILLLRKNKISQEEFNELNGIRGKIQRKLIASITTAKNNDN